MREVTEVGGYVGNFKVQVRQASKRSYEVPAGTIIVATGFEPSTPTANPNWAMASTRR